MKKLGKFTALCVALLIVIGCVTLGGCRKAESQDSAGTTTTGIASDGDIIIDSDDLE